MGAPAGRSGHEAKGIYADYFTKPGVEWSIGLFSFRWLPEPMTLVCLLNGMPFQKWQITINNSPREVREFSATIVTEHCSKLLREASVFKRSLGPEPRDRHV
jgi:hypothetical protein